mmetsp:Transcript_1346/g.3901  ORF Transcript_1346/g.3901 Transcript_1346/m.3901 type:complete len:299 (+) Transcript_1346:10453-11349(+)
MRGLDTVFSATAMNSFNSANSPSSFGGDLILWYVDSHFCKMLLARSCTQSTMAFKHVFARLYAMVESSWIMSAHWSWKSGKSMADAANISISSPAFRYAATLEVVPSTSIGSSPTTSSVRRYVYSWNCFNTFSGPCKLRRTTASVRCLASSSGSYWQRFESGSFSGSNIRYEVKLQKGTSSYSHVQMASVTFVIFSKSLNNKSTSSSAFGTSRISPSSAMREMLINGHGSGFEGDGTKASMKSTQSWMDSPMNHRICDDRTRSSFRNTLCNGDFMYCCKSSMKKLCSSAKRSLTSAIT